MPLSRRIVNYFETAVWLTFSFATIMQRNRCAHTTCFAPWRRVNIKKNYKGHDLRGCCHNDNPFVSSIFNADFFSWNRQLFFPSVNINCPFKLFQNFISSLKFYRIIKHRIRFHYRETLLRGLPLCLACSSIWLVNSEMTEFQSCSDAGELHK